MANSEDNFGPWLEEQPIIGICVCCFREKCESDIYVRLSNEEVECMDGDEHKEIKFHNPKNLLLVVCRQCMATDDDMFGVPMDWSSDEDNNDEEI